MKSYLFWLIKKTTPIFQPTGLQRVTPVKEIRNFIVRNLKPSMTLVHGQKMFLDANDSLRLSYYGECEKVQTNLFMKIVKKGDVVLDIGAHIGYYTLIAAKSVGPTGRVYAFEPDPVRFTILQKNIALNKHHNVRVFQKAVLDKKSKVDLPILFDGVRKLHTEVVALDQFLKDKKINVVKMDIDGGEDAVLRGMENILKKNSSIKLFIELWPAGLKHFGSNSKNLLNRLKKLRFNYLEINEKNQRIHSVTENYLLKNYTEYQSAYKIKYTTLFCFRK